MSPSSELSTHRDRKHALAMRLPASGERSKAHLSFHGIPLRLTFPDFEWREFLLSLFPAAWRRFGDPCLTLNWWPASNWEQSEAFDDDPDPAFDRRSGTVVQRDFAARWDSDSEVSVASLLGSPDGVFNAFRWLTPAAGGKLGRFVAHSAVVVGRDGRARVFLGPSGAGKSTVASLAEERVVFGDDVNLLIWDGRRLLVEPAVLGQRWCAWDHLDRPAEVAAFYWLRQGDVALKKLRPAELARCLAHSLHLTDARGAGAQLDAVGAIARAVTGYELAFSRDPRFWEVIDGGR